MNEKVVFTASKYRYTMVILFFLVFNVLLTGYYTEWFTELPTLDGDFKRSFAIILMPFTYSFFIYLLLLNLRSPNVIKIFYEDNVVFFDQSKLCNIKNIKITQSAISRYQIIIELLNDKKIKTAHYYKCDHNFENLKSSFTSSRITQILPGN